MIGCGGIALQKHLPGFALHPRCKLLPLCDSHPPVLAKAKHTTGLSTPLADHHDAPKHPLVALCDSNPAVLEKAKQTTGLSTAFADYHDVLKHPGVDAVVIATPNFVHAPMAIAAAEAKKHVLCEKPIAMSFDESRRMLDAV